MPLSFSGIKREHVESFLVDLRGREGVRNGESTGEKLSPAYILKQYKGLKLFFNWAVEEGEIKRSPMEYIKPPRVPEQPVPVLSDEDLRWLLKACEGRDFYARHDLAIVRLLIDTGMWRSEIGKLRVEDFDFDAGLAWVVGKGGRERACPFRRKTAQALDRYLRARGEYRGATGQTALWLGGNGAMVP